MERGSPAVRRLHERAFSFMDEGNYSSAIREFEKLFQFVEKSINKFATTIFWRITKAHPYRVFF